MTTLFPLFQFGCLLFLLLIWLLWLELPILCWIRVVRVDSLVFFPSFVSLCKVDLCYCPTPTVGSSHIDFPHCLMSTYSFMTKLKYLLFFEGCSCRDGGGNDWRRPEKLQSSSVAPWIMVYYLYHYLAFTCFSCFSIWLFLTLPLSSTLFSQLLSYCTCLFVLWV